MRDALQASNWQSSPSSLGYRDRQFPARIFRKTHTMHMVRLLPVFALGLGLLACGQSSDPSITGTTAPPAEIKPPNTNLVRSASGVF
jgi:hypothetical protein